MNQKSVLVTGATNGTGYAIASRFARGGYDVFISSRNPKHAEEAAARLAQECGVFAKGYSLAPTDEEQIKAVFDDIRSHGYLLDTFVANAANLGLNMDDTLAIDLKDYRQVIETNMVWNFAMARQAALQMKEKGHGALVFITSNTAYRAIPGRAAYCASKSGILGLSRALAVDLGQYGIRSNCVLPGMIKTDRWYNSPTQQNSLTARTPLGDVAEFEDIAEAAWYLGSDASRNTTGAELSVDGGNLVQLTPRT